MMNLAVMSLLRGNRVKAGDRAPCADADSAGQLTQFDHAVCEKDQHRMVIWIGLPPAAACARPTDRANAAAATQRISLLGFHDYRDSHTVTMSCGEDGPAKHPRSGALFWR